MANLTFDCDEVLAKHPGALPPLQDGLKQFVWILLALLPLLTLIGNGVVILSVARFRYLRTKANAFVVSLAVADICVALLIVPFRAVELGNDHIWPLGETFCDIVNVFDCVFSTASILNLSCLACDRYLAISRPFLHVKIRHKTTVVMILSCWIIPILAFVVPIVWHWNLSGVEHLSYCFTKVEKGCPLLMNKPYSVFSTLVSFYVPTIFMAVCYSRIFAAARRHARNLQTLAHRDAEFKDEGRLQQETKAAKTLGIVMGCFCVCWFPFILINTADPFLDFTLPNLAKLVAMWLGYLNSTMNPILFYVFSRQFKMAYKQLFMCCKIRRDMFTGLSRSSQQTVI